MSVDDKIFDDGDFWLIPPFAHLWLNPMLETPPPI